MPAIPESTKTSLAQRLRAHARQNWPQLAMHVRYRAQFAYVEGELAGFYLALWLIFPDQLGLGDVKIAASIGIVLAWGSWSELFLGALAGALLGAAYARVLSARRGPTGPVYLPLGPFLLAGAFVVIALLPPGGTLPSRARRQAPRGWCGWRGGRASGW